MANRPNKSFSLASLMLVVLVVALVVSQIVLFRQLADVRAELAAARQAYKEVIAGKIQPPGGVPLRAWAPGTRIGVEFLKKATERLKAAPKAELDKWVDQLERISGHEFKSEVERQGCRTDFVNQMSVAFDGLKWNAAAANQLFLRAQAMPTSAAKAWTEAFETLLNKKLPYPHVVALAMIPVDALHEGQQYSAERGNKYLARMKQLTEADIAIWKDKVDEFGGTQLDAAVNIILLDEYFDKETFQRDKFLTATGSKSD